MQCAIEERRPSASGDIWRWRMGQMTEAKPVGQDYLDDMRQMFRDYKKMAEKAMAQVSDEQLFYAPDAESNSIAVIVKHMAGNMRSRWTDFLTSDGEKPDRNRDQEFELNEGCTRVRVR